MSWMTVIAPFIVGIIVVFVPGLLLAVALKMRGFDAFGIAPALSVAMVSISAMVAPMVGVDWALWVPFVFALLIAALGFAVNYATEKISGRRPTPSSQPEVAGVTVGHASSDLVPARWFSKNQGFYWLSFILGFILLARNTTNAIGQPGWISQTYDANFHLNAVRYIADHANGSSLFIASMTSGNEPPDFYPAAWHDIASLMFMSTGSEIPVVTNALALLVSAVIWSISLLFFVRNVFKLNKFGIIAVGLLASAFVAFPYLLIDFGVLYPNLLGIALMPAGLAVVSQMFRMSIKQRMTTQQTIFLGLFVALGIAIAHPNAIMSLLVLLIPIFVGRGILQIISAIQKKTSWLVALLQIVGIAAILWLINYLWGVVRPPKESGGWEPSASQSQSFGEFITNGIMGWPSLWFVTILAVVGIYALVRSRNRSSFWVLGSAGVLCWFYMAARYLIWDEGRDWVVGVWYHDAYRVAAMLPLLMVPLGAVGVHWIAFKIAENNVARTMLEKYRLRRSQRTTGTTSAEANATSPAGKGISVALLTLAVVVLAYGGQTAKPLEKFVNDTFWTYAPDPESPLLTEDEYTVLEKIDDYVPENDAVIVQPWTGGALTYAVSGREVNAYHTNFVDTEATDLVDQKLKYWQSTPGVCSALDSLDAKYYLDFGTKEILDADHSIRYAGLIHAGEAPGFKEVYRSGDAALYEITACK